ncbi:MAG: cation transporter [Bdellovibrio sp.]|nr:cation transporter [Bdellovibrio sp.]
MGKDSHSGGKESDSNHDHHHEHDLDPTHTHSHGAHPHLHFGHTHTEGPRAITRAMIITLVFMAFEFIGGWFANSLALISDGAHMLTDVGALLLSLFAFWMARRPVTLSMSFGYHRAEILGALTSGLLIWGISGVLIYEAIIRLQSPPEVKGPVVFVVASIGLVANLASMWMLRNAKEENLNTRAAYLHMLSDSLGSVGAIIAGAVLWFSGWQMIDPIMTILFAILMLVSSWSLVKESLNILMESTPAHLNPSAIKRDLEKIQGVEESHDLHIWSVSSGKYALSVHLISKDAEVLNQANDLLKARYGIVHTTIQVEHPDRFQSERCYDCVPIELKP